MGYFSNGTEGMAYQERYCLKCRHWRDLRDGRGEGCPVWDAHLIFNRDEGSEGVLDLLIPRKGPGGVFNDECAMFLSLGLVE